MFLRPYNPNSDLALKWRQARFNAISPYEFGGGGDGEPPFDDGSVPYSFYAPMIHWDFSTNDTGVQYNVIDQNTGYLAGEFAYRQNMYEPETNGVGISWTGSQPSFISQAVSYPSGQETYGTLAFVFRAFIGNCQLSEIVPIADVINLKVLAIQSNGEELGFGIEATVHDDSYRENSFLISESDFDGLAGTYAKYTDSLKFDTVQSRWVNIFSIYQFSPGEYGAENLNEFMGGTINDVLDSSTGKMIQTGDAEAYLRRSTVDGGFGGDVRGYVTTNETSAHAILPIYFDSFSIFKINHSSGVKANDFIKFVNDNPHWNNESGTWMTKPKYYQNYEYIEPALGWAQSFNFVTRNEYIKSYSGSWSGGYIYKETPSSFAITTGLPSGINDFDEYIDVFPTKTSPKLYYYIDEYGSTIYYSFAPKFAKINSFDYESTDGIRPRYVKVFNSMSPNVFRYHHHTGGFAINAPFVSHTPSELTIITYPNLSGAGITGYSEPKLFAVGAVGGSEIDITSLALTSGVTNWGNSAAYDLALNPDWASANDLNSISILIKYGNGKHTAEDSYYLGLA